MRSLILAVIMPAVIVLSACSEKAQPIEEPRPVATFVLGEGTAGITYSFAGDVKARHETSLAFRIGGKLQQRLVDAGALVKAGQPVAQLDPADVALQMTQAEAQRSLAEADLKRYRELREKNFISQSALDVRETAFKLAQAQAGLTRNAQAYATLRADADGVVAATLAEPGQVLAAGEPVVMLAHAGERELAISLPESSVGLYRVGDTAQIHLWVMKDKTYHGKVREISPAADPSTRTFPARVTVLDADADVALGMSGHVVFISHQEQGAVVPATAIYQQGGLPAVWVIDDKNLATLRPVKVAKWRDDDVLVTEGLHPGERIVAMGVHKIRAGEKLSYKSTD